MQVKCILSQFGQGFTHTITTPIPHDNQPLTPANL